ncbi:uncharacterized protein EAF02_007274 [Botrytis sinoallii]|uniref:uncharacterized protein n=1 Tax=Botrytis sinoallii TaxID=1463999 RepID=UPI0019010B4B|nr:uncharacterized protein EAF02_007274 [Botrytis sinoallii]KAF7880428.1 hypothetical protein EAF02_007274 [Botrytis sinoallii]
MSSLPPKASDPEFQSTESMPAFGLLPTEIHLRIFAHYWSFGSLKFENAVERRVMDVTDERYDRVKSDDVRSEMALLYVNKKIHDRFEDFIYGQARLRLRFCIVHVFKPELRSWLGEPWKNMWPPSMLVDDVETVLRTYLPLLRRVRDVRIHIEFPYHKTEVPIKKQQHYKLGQLRKLTEVITTSFPSLELPGIGRLEVGLHANNSSSEDLEALMPIFHMNVAHKELFELGYKERTNFTIGRRDREDHRMNFENARGRYYMSIGKIVPFIEPTLDKSCEDVQNNRHDSSIDSNIPFNGKDEVLSWTRCRVWEQVVYSGYWNKRARDRREKALFRVFGTGNFPLSLAQRSR